ncbi:MAG: hypothetical protein ABI599_07855 [Flavobacteriales bacterium]
MAEKTLPESLDWYRQTANWLVGLAAAGLAGLASIHTELDIAAGWPLIWIKVAGGAMLLTILAGVLFYDALTNFGNAYEAHMKFESTKPGAQGDVLRRINADLKRQETRKKRQLLMYSVTYSVMLIAFIVAFIGVVGLLWNTVGNAAEPDVPHRVILVDGKGTGPGTLDDVMLIDIGSGTCWSLVRDSVSGVVRWDTANAYVRELGAKDPR